MCAHSNQSAAKPESDIVALRLNGGTKSPNKQRMMIATRAQGNSETYYNKAGMRRR
jgi:hypothetical protein